MVNETVMIILSTLVVSGVVGGFFLYYEDKEMKKSKKKVLDLEHISNSSPKPNNISNVDFFPENKSSDDKNIETNNKKKEKRDPYSLTQEEIDDIHKRGKITAIEQVKEWEDMGLCAPGDAMGSAAWRCDKFGNCHDCLVDYASSNIEYTSFYDIVKAFDVKKFMEDLHSDLSAEDMYIRKDKQKG